MATGTEDANTQCTIMIIQFVDLSTVLGSKNST